MVALGVEEASNIYTTGGGLVHFLAGGAASVKITLEEAAVHLRGEAGAR